VSDGKSLGQVAYEAYAAKGRDAGKSSISGSPLPLWDQQRPAIQERWEAAGQAVEQDVLGKMNLEE
jgi:hypothetical protein